ncbi:MAG: DUF2141 domain-containing protein [Lutibacter sp.]|uniref:DUF2141 domain-containing protein n=1 Tax=Lutibacter sp. TaxID=1925666 RepID=UPI00385D03AC
MQHIILTIALFFSTLFFGQTKVNENNFEGNKITVSVVNVLNDNGNIHFAFHNENTFMKATPLYAKSSTIENGICTVVFENIPEGEYAILCFHDENKNGRMDFDERGIPIESYGTSNNVMNFGPPQFESAKFEVFGKNIKLEIRF